MKLAKEYAETKKTRADEVGWAIVGLFLIGWFLGLLGGLYGIKIGGGGD